MSLGLRLEQLRSFFKLGHRVRRTFGTRLRLRLEGLEDRTVPSVFTPTTFQDGVSGGGQVQTLRDAVIAANQDTTGSGTDVIQLSAGTYTLSVQNTSGPTDATQGDLNLANTTHTLVIEGADSNHPTATVIDASQLNDRVFQVAPGVTVQFKDLVIQGGHAQDDGATAQSNAAGGGILNNGGDVTLSNVVVQSNQATPVPGGWSSAGGGIYSAGGSVTLTNSVVRDNTASQAVNSPNPLATRGGGIDTEGSLVSISNSLISGNRAIGGTGLQASQSGYGGGVGGAGLGGGIYVANGSVQIAATTISGNTARGGDGGLGRGGGFGGEGGYADGGGLYLGPGEVTVRDSTVSGNFVVGGKGGNGGNGAPGGIGGNGGTGGGADGGGFHIQDGTLVLINTTVANNNPYSGAGGDGGNGAGTGRGGDGGNGGVAWGGGIGNARTLDTFNVTIAGNFVWAGAGGAAGIAAGGAPSGAQGLIGSTQGGGIWNDGSNPVNLTNTIIATNIASTGPDFVGTVTSSDHTLIGDNKDANGFSAAQNGDIVGTPDARINPLLGQLQDNGGPTQTMALLAGSPAIDHGDTSALSATGPHDQRGAGFARLVNSIVDIGAVEFSPVAVTTTAGNAVTKFSSGDQTITLTAAVTGPKIVNEGTVTFTVNGTSLTAVANVTGGTATATLTLPAGFAAGTYSFSASYTDSNGNFKPSTDRSGTLTVNAAATQTTLLSTTVNSTYNSGTPQTVTLNAAVLSGSPVNEGTVTFSVNGTNLTATALVTDGTATATLTVPAGFATGIYTLSASYADTANANGTLNYSASASAASGQFTVNSATVTTTPLNIANVIQGHKIQLVTLAANVSSANGGTVKEGSVTFTIINPNGANLTATGNVTGGTATATVTLPNNFAPGTYVYIASYADSNNGNGVPNYAASSGAGTVDPPDGTLTVVDPPTDSGAALPPVSSPPVSPPVSSPVGSLSLFALGIGPTGIDLFEVDSQGDIFAQSLFGGSPVLVSTALHLSSALMSDDGLMALLAGDNGQSYVLDVIDPSLPSIEAAVLIALQL